MKSISYFEFNLIYQGMNIIHAATGRKMIKAAVFNACRGKEYILHTLEQNPEFIIQEKTAKELHDWEKAIMSSRRSTSQAEEESTTVN